MPHTPLKELLKDVHTLLTPVCDEPLVRDAQGRHVLGGQVALFNRLDRHQAKAIARATGLPMVEFATEAEAKAHHGQGKLVFVKGQPFTKPVLGAGSFGSFHLAERVADGAIVGVKKLKNDEVIQESFLEMAMQAKLQGIPSVLPVYGSFLGRHYHQGQPTAAKVLYHVMPLGGLGSVHALLAALATVTDSVLRELVMTRVIQGILLGLWHMHQRGIYHLDVKPHNVVVNAQGEVFLIDFGCAVEIRDKPPWLSRTEDAYEDLAHGIQVEASIGQGDVRYFSPERQKGSRTHPFDASATDVWAAGVTLVELLVGRTIAKRGLPRVTVLEDLARVEDMPLLVDLAQQLLADSPPPLATLLNHRALLRPEAHEASVQETAVSYLKAFIRQQAGAYAIAEDGLDHYADTREDATETATREGEGPASHPEKPSVASALRSPDTAHNRPSLSEGPSAVEATALTGEVLPSTTPVTARADSLTARHRLLQHQRRQLQPSGDAPPWYVPLQASTDREGQHVVELAGQVETWLSSARTVLLLLAEGGAGKSTFGQHLALELMGQAMAEVTPSTTPPPWLPLYVALNTVQDPRHLLKEILQHRYQLSGVQAQALRDQRLLLILDGYDELPHFVNLYVENQLQHWPQVKLLITCRPSALDATYKIHFLPYQQEQGVSARLKELYVVPFSSERIAQYVDRYVRVEQARLQTQVAGGSLNKRWLTADAYGQALHTNPSLALLASNPYRLRLLLAVLPTLALTGRAIPAVAVYEAAREQRHRAELAKLALTADEQAAYLTRLYTVEAALADHLQATGTVTLSYRPRWRFDAPRGMYAETVAPDEVRFDGLLSVHSAEGAWQRRALGLRPTAVGVYGFEHLSQLEYLQARAWYEELRALGAPRGGQEPAWVNLACQTSLARYGLTQDVVEGRVRFTDKGAAKLNFLSQWAVQDPVFAAVLYAAVAASAHASALSILAANSLTVLNYARLPLTGQAWAGISVPWADLGDANLDGTDLSGANLRGVRLARTWLRQVRLIQAELTNVHWGERSVSRYESDVDALVYSPDGHYRAMAISKDVVVEHGVTGNRQTMCGHTRKVTSVAWSVAGELASGSWDQTIIIWDQASGQVARRFTGHTEWVNSVAWSVAGKLASGSSDNTVIIWDQASGQIAQRFTGHEDTVTSVAWSTLGELASGSYDSTVIVWDNASGQVAQRFTGHKGRVRSVAWSETGTLASGSWDGVVIIWDQASGQIAQCFTGHTDGVNSVAWSVAGVLASVGDNTVIIWDQASGQIAQCFTGHTGDVLSVAWSALGELASGSSDNTVIVWDQASGQVAQRFIRHTERVRSVAWSALRGLASGGDNTVIIWDQASSQIAQRFTGHTEEVLSVAWSALGKLASGSYDSTVIVWDQASGQVAQHFTEHEGPVTSVAWSASGELASGSEDKTVIVWDQVSGQVAQRFTEHEGSVTSVAWSASGELASGSEDKSVVVWDRASGQAAQRFTGHTERVRSVAWSVLGELASGSEDKTVIVWDKVSGQVAQRFRGHTERVRSVAWSVLGELASGSEDKTVIVWDKASGQPRVWLTGYLGEIRSLFWLISDGQTFLATGSGDNTVKVWQRVAETKESDHWRLVWSSHYLTLIAEGCDVSGASGLTAEQGRLLQQKGAVLELPMAIAPTQCAVENQASLVFQVPEKLVIDWLTQGKGLFNVLPKAERSKQQLVASQTSLEEAAEAEERGSYRSHL